MAIVFDSIPPELSPAYIPLPFVISTTRYPNVIAGEQGITITSIGLPTLAELSANPTLEVDDVMVRHFTATINVGDHILIYGTGGIYAGVYRVLKSISTGLTVIETVNLGTDTGGSWDKYYHGLKIMAQVYIDGSKYGDPWSLKPDSNGKVTLDVRKDPQESMGLTKLALNAGAINIADTKGTCQVRVEAWEAYDVPAASGIPVFTEDLDGLKSSADVTIVNADQPYYFDRPGQVYSFDDKLTPYIHVGATLLRRFLTHSPRGHDMPIARDENARIDWLQGITGGARKIRVITYDGSGTVIATNDTNFVASVKKTYGIQCGPADLAWITTATVRYTVQVIESLTSLQLSEVYGFRVEPAACNVPRVRFHWRNRLGQFDSFTFNGPQIDEGVVTSRITSTDNVYGKAGQIRHVRKKRSTKSTHGLTIATEFIPQAFIQWLQSELTESPEVFMTGPGYSTYIPVIIADGAQQAWDTKTDRGVFSLTYSFANETPHQRVA